MFAFSKTALTIAAGISCLVAFSPAQTSSTELSGSVSDIHGVMLPGASVAVVNDATGARVRRLTNSAGLYAFRAVAVGRYTLTVELKGYKTARRPGVALVDGAAINEDFALVIGDSSQDSAPVTEDWGDPLTLTAIAVAVLLLLAVCAKVWAIWIRASSAEQIAQQVDRNTNGESPEFIEEREALHLAKPWLKGRLVMISIGFGAIALGALSFYFALLSGGAIDSSLGDLARGKTDPAHMFDAGGNLLGGLTFAFGGVALAGYGVVVIAVSISKILVGPPRSCRTPEGTVRRFYGRVFGPSKRDFRMLEAYICLTSGAKQQFEGWQGFRSHWLTVRNDGESATLGRPQMMNSGAGETTYEIEIKFTKQQVTSYTRKAEGQLVQHGERWYLSHRSIGASQAF
jgi:hypothetical protein